LTESSKSTKIRKRSFPPDRPQQVDHHCVHAAGASQDLVDRRDNTMVSGRGWNFTMVDPGREITDLRQIAISVFVETRD
jgi:hypothetical protein